MAESPQRPAAFVAIGGSAGAIEALQRFLPHLPADLPAAVGVVLHRSAVSDDERLPHVLSRNCALPIAHAHDGETIRPGQIYLAPAALHLRVSDGTFALDAGPRENSSRPAIDVLFRTAANAFGSHTIGVLLSGLLDDGAAGLAAIVACGGRALVQAPGDAAFSDMPRNALAAVAVDASVPADDLAAHVVRLLDEAAHAPPGGVLPEVEGEPTGLTCPDCGGLMRRSHVLGVTRYRCRTGHEYSESGLFERQDESVENALWSAIRVLEERAELCSSLATKMRNRDLTKVARRLDGQRDEALAHASAVRGALATIAQKNATAEASAQTQDAGDG